MIDYTNSFADWDMFACFARIGIGHQIQYTLPNVTEDENLVGDDDDELLAEGDLEPTTSNTGGQILDSDVGNCQNQALGDETDDEDVESDTWDDCDSENYGESEDEGPDFKF
jgi:hypothetical protein